MKRVCVYCGSSDGRSPSYTAAAHALGKGLAARNLELVYGGASIGLMGTVANAALEDGGRVVGIVPQILTNREIVHDGLTELHRVESMHTRKAKMADLADAFVALPGGMGTFDEICEILTWAALGLHAKPCFFINTNGYWEPFRALLDHAMKEGFLAPEVRAQARFVDTPDQFFQALGK